MSKARNVHASIDWRDFQGREVLLPICPRSPNVQRRNFIALLDAMVPRISTVHVIMCDYLDRYNFNGDGDKVLVQSKAWQKQYFSEILARFDKVECTDWMTISRTEGFSERLDTLTSLYQTNTEVRKAIDAFVTYYVNAKAERLTHDGETFDVKVLEENSRRYMIEEFAGTALYKNLLPNAPEVYWGTYVDDLGIFQRNAVGVDLALPLTLPVHNSRLGGSIAIVPSPLAKAA